jgi:hypothetical protein
MRQKQCDKNNATKMVLRFTRFQSCSVLTYEMNIVFMYEEVFPPICVFLLKLLLLLAKILSCEKLVLEKAQRFFQFVCTSFHSELGPLQRIF